MSLIFAAKNWRLRTQKSLWSMDYGALKPSTARKHRLAKVWDYNMDNLIFGED